MIRPTKDNSAESKRATEMEHEQVAFLAAKVATLPTHDEPGAGQSANPTHSVAKAALRATRRSGGIVYWLLWLVTLSLGLVAGLRLFDHDGTLLLIWLNAFTRYVYLPAYACLAWAAWNRRWWLVLANVAIVGLHVAWIEPDFVRDRRFDSVASDSLAAPVRSAQTVRIFFANVNGFNTERESLLQEIKHADPDVIVLVEFSSPWSSAFRHSQIISAYPYGNGLRQSNIAAVNVFSRLPLKSERQEWVAGRGIDTIEIPIGAQSLHIIGLHAPRPMKNRGDDYQGFWSRTIPMLLTAKGPLVVVGDFNATQYSRVYQRLTAGRLRSAHQDRGRGYATSWPNGQFWLPPIRIDQALLSPELECLGIAEGEGRGSDHKPLIVDVQLRANL